MTQAAALERCGYWLGDEFCGDPITTEIVVRRRGIYWPLCEHHARLSLALPVDPDITYTEGKP